MVCISGDVVIARPPEVVFDVLADERNEPAYNPRMLRVEKLTPGPIRAGTRFEALLRSGMRTTAMTVEYTTVDRPWEIVSTSTLSWARIVGRLTLERLPWGTRLWWSWDLRPVGWVRLFRPVLRVLGNRQERRIWTQLKRQLEAQSEVRPASEAAPV